MSEAHAREGKSGYRHRHRLYTMFKWLVYLSLAWNTIQFLLEDLAASAEVFGDSISLLNLVEAYSAFIDSSAWLVLLLVFELETAVLSDTRLKGGLKWTLRSVRAVCYFFIVYALYGYVSKYLLVSDLLPFTLADVCTLAGSGWTYVVRLDNYPPIDSTNCVALQGQQLMQVAGTSIIGTGEALDSAWRLAVTDIVNAATWLAVVAMLEIEVWMQSAGRLTERLFTAARYLKGILYLVLFLAAAYWGIEGRFLDFWDAFLWLAAFIFIELNLFRWREEDG